MRSFYRICLVTVVLLVMACGGSKPARFYLLTSTNAKPDNTNHDVGVGIWRITIPNYLERPQIVTYAGSNQLTVAEFDRWGEQLEDNLVRVLAENLSRQIPTENVALFPWPASTKITYRVSTEVLEFEQKPDGQVSFSARWVIYDESGDKALVRNTFVQRKPTGQGSYEEIVAAMSQLLAALSSDIAGGVRGLSGTASNGN